ncbi:hypothetical protein REMIM1_CH01288 [Rhizobium etli bv. mimosae str. Mim1]|nr:hypothetical protein REMIM1_CH01288 [Rhizobium etli bv. mimosae str. Mim1]
MKAGAVDSDCGPALLLRRERIGDTISGRLAAHGNLRNRPPCHHFHRSVVAESPITTDLPAARWKRH